MKIQLAENETLVLRTSNADGTSRNNFKWPKQGPVKCPDWLPTKDCGNGLHGALMGEGDGSLFNWKEDALWQVVRVNKNEIIDLGGKVKFPNGFVVYSGDRKTATDIIYDNGGKAVIGGTQIVGDERVATTGYKGITTTGDYGIATAGNYGTATTGYGGIATAGINGTAMAGINGTSTVGNHGIAIAKYQGTATAGVNGTAKAGDYGTATAKYGGIATAGYGGAATVGDRGTATAGHYGIATAGESGVAIARTFSKCCAGINGRIAIDYWDETSNCSRTKIGYIGKNSLKPNTYYELDNKHNFVKAE